MNKARRKTNQRPVFYPAADSLKKMYKKDLADGMFSSTRLLYQKSKSEIFFHTKKRNVFFDAFSSEQARWCEQKKRKQPCFLFWMRQCVYSKLIMNICGTFIFIFVFFSFFSFGCIYVSFEPFDTCLHHVGDIGPFIKTERNCIGLQ